MDHKHGVEASSPVATIEDIHKRLTRPPHQSSSSLTASHLYELQDENSPNSDTSPLQKRRKPTTPPDQQSSSSVIAHQLYELHHQNSSQSNFDKSELQKRRKSRAVKVKLEDYFDLSLLSAARVKMNGSMKKQSRKMKMKSGFEEFVWPAGAGDHHDSELFSESHSRRTDEAIVDLKNDDDDSFEDGEKNHVIGVDLFQLFESTALMRFKR